MSLDLRRRATERRQRGRGLAFLFDCLVIVAMIGIVGLIAVERATGQVFGG